MPPAIPSKATHEQWLGLVQPVGLVVAPAVLSKLELFPNQGTAYLAARQRQLEALLRRGVPAVAGGVPGFVEVAAPRIQRGEIEHQGLQALAFQLRHAVGGAQGFAVFGQHHLGDGLQLIGALQVGLAPVEQFRGQQREARHHLDRFARCRAARSAVPWLGNSSSLLSTAGATTRPTGCTRPSHCSWSALVGMP